MHSAEMLAQLASDGAALRDAATDLNANVPTCPGWTVRDAVEHTAVVYAHKATIVEEGLLDWPKPWPPKFDYDDVVQFYDEQLQRVVEALRSHDPATHVVTWYEPEQTVGFWIRRMMQETVIHRADVESASGDMARAPDTVAVDGIDELLERMLCDDVDSYAEAPGDGQRVAVHAGDAVWTVTLGADAASLERSADGSAQAVLRGSPGDLLLALWNRLPYDAIISYGDEGALDALRRAIAATTQ